MAVALHRLHVQPLNVIDEILLLVMANHLKPEIISSSLATKRRRKGRYSSFDTDTTVAT
jgi:hypothetical protein